MGDPDPAGADPFARLKRQAAERSDRTVERISAGIAVLRAGGQKITAESGVRFSHHLVWRAAAHGFQGYQQWSSKGENQDLGRFVARATPRQREVLGFPPPGHAYWNEQTVAAVKLRYPEMDMAPYVGRRRGRTGPRVSEV